MSLPRGVLGWREKEQKRGTYPYLVVVIGTADLPWFSFFAGLHTKTLDP